MMILHNDTRKYIYFCHPQGDDHGLYVVNYCTNNARYLFAKETGVPYVDVRAYRVTKIKGKSRVDSKILLPDDDLLKNLNIWYYDEKNNKIM